MVFFRPHQREVFVLAAVLAALVFGFPVFAQTVMTVSDITEYARKNSREIEAAEEEVREAGEMILEVFSFDKSTLSVSGGYNYDPASDFTGLQQNEGPTEHTVSVDSNVTVPIIPELSVSAGIGNTFLDGRDDVTATVRLNYTPFGDPSTTWQKWETLRRAEIRLAKLKNSVPMHAEVAALNLAKGQFNLEAAERSMKLAEREYEIFQKRYELDDITYTELEESRAKASESRQAYYNSLRSLLNLKKNLYQIIGPDISDIEIAALSTEDVLLLVQERESSLEAARADDPASVDLLNLAVEIEALKRQFDATPAYRPSLSLSGSMNFNDFRAGASVGLTLSPDHFQTEERAEIRGEIADRESDLVLEQANNDLEVRMLEQSISVAEEALYRNISDYESLQIQYRETELLHGRGERTDLELEQSALSLFSASIRVFSSAVDLYANLGDLLELYLLD